MSQAHFQLYHKGAVFFTALIPAEEWLYEWYERCGYARHIMVTAPPTDVDNMDFDSFDKWQRSKDCVLLHDAEVSILSGGPSHCAFCRPEC